MDVIFAAIMVTLAVLLFFVAAYFIVDGLGAWMIRKAEELEAKRLQHTCPLCERRKSPHKLFCEQCARLCD